MKFYILSNTKDELNVMKNATLFIVFLLFKNGQTQLPQLTISVGVLVKI